MFEVQMAAPRSHLDPFVLLEQTNHLTHLHWHQAHGTLSSVVRAAVSRAPWLVCRPVGQVMRIRSWLSVPQERIFERKETPSVRSAGVGSTLAGKRNLATPTRSLA